MRANLILMLSVLGCTQSAEYAPEQQSMPAASDGTTQQDDVNDVESDEPMTQLGILPGMLEVWIERADIEMGLNSDDQDYDDFHIPHLVELTHESVSYTHLTLPTSDLV